MTELANGAYEHVVTRGLERQLLRLDQDLIEKAQLDAADSHEILGRHLATIVHRALLAVPGQGIARIEAQLDLANHIAEAIAAKVPRAAQPDDLMVNPAELLTAIVPRPPAPASVVFPIRPETPLSTGALLTNGRGQPKIGGEVNREMASATSVDLLCAFIKWHGVRLLQKSVADLTARGGELRIITTTYMGATEQRAVDRLAELGAKIKISYETRTTRLHAKAWVFRRGTGTTTAYVGSSNLSKSALIDGMEWNIRLAELEQPALVDTIAGTFADYWNDPSFEDYDPRNPADSDRLRAALEAESGRKPADDSMDITSIDVRPYPYQQEILERLDAEREVHGRNHSLVVMATGTGKTVVAGLDYRRLRQRGIKSLLFVAHQERILRQSRSVFRQVLRDGTFGELFVGGERPRDWQHVFASVQSLHRLDLDQLDPGRFDMVIVDEFHHAEAATYQKLLGSLAPKILLGLTATPERADGLDIRRWFDGHTAVELRLWEALERQLLAPFQYFGVHDEVDLHAIRWRRGGGYDTAELENLYTGDDARVRIILEATRNTVDVGRMKGIGFCVSIKHADFMAARFQRANIPSRSLHSKVAPEVQREAVEQLQRGDLKMLFTVDMFNEGVDLPTVDTILMLRPTESATIFLQQLGRGLRLADDKPCLTVLDFIGGQRGEFRFDRRYRALTGASRRMVIRDVEQDFPTLPAGCHIELDRIAKQIVLDNIRQALRLPRNAVVAELRELGDVPLAEFLAETGLEIEDVYRRRSGRGWTGLREDAGVITPSASDDVALSAAIGRLLHVDDMDRVTALRDLADGSPVTGRLGAMMHQTLWGGSADPAGGPARLRDLPHRRAELLEVADILAARIERVTDRLDPIPLRVHARYSRNEVCAAFGIADPSNVREGVKWLPDENADIFFVTLTKTERHYSPTTMYQDRAITDTLFQWESQSTTASASQTGQRYIDHQARGSSVHLFLRETKEPDGDLGVPPYLYAGPMTYVEHSGDRPMRILWRLSHPLPADTFHAARLAAA